MARDLTKHDNNTLTMLDSISGTEIVFTYRTPTTSDRVQYQARKFRREGNKLINCSRTAAVTGAVSLLTGIRDSDFVIDGKPLSCDPTSEHYRADWKTLIEDMAGDLLFILGYELFEGRIDLGAMATLEMVDEVEPKQQEPEIIPPLV